MARRQAGRSARARIVGTLDIGSSKIACLVTEVTGASGSGDLTIRVLGSGIQRSQGVKAGVIVDPDKVETAVRAAVAQAERASGVALIEVYVAITCGRLASRAFAAHADIGPRGVTDADIARLFEGARAYSERDGRALVHMNRKLFRLDGEPGGEDPRGMAGARLTAEIHAVTADDATIRNLIHMVQRCHLQVAGLVAAPYASALAVTSEDERRLGVTVVDMGGGTTTIAVFGEGQFRHCEAIPTGGHHLTFDIAQNLHAPLAEAERIKTLYASMVNAQSDVNDRFSYALAGESDGVVNQATRAQLSGAIRPRVENLMGEIAVRLETAGSATGPVVLTGGASALVGMAGFASLCLGREVWLARPRAVLGLPAAADSPAFAASVGVGLAAPDGGWRGADETGNGTGYLSRVGRWIRSSF